ncbi:MAG: MAPEG family protein [Sphingomicrobium sp.]
MNPFSRTQVGVALGMAFGLLVTTLAFAWPSLPIIPQDEGARIGLWLAVSVSVATWLLIGIALLARYRFFNSADINGGAFGDGTGGARLLQALIQNSLEQVVLAIPAYGAWVWLAPEGRRGLVVICAALFSLGRLLFFLGYRFGAAARAPGFTLTFYPTVGLYIFLLPRIFSQLFG